VPVARVRRPTATRDEGYGRVSPRPAAPASLSRATAELTCRGSWGLRLTRGALGSTMPGGLNGERLLRPHARAGVSERTGGRREEACLHIPSCRIRRSHRVRARFRGFPRDAHQRCDDLPYLYRGRLSGPPTSRHVPQWLLSCQGHTSGGRGCAETGFQSEAEV